jgi:peptidoglycan/LPS O-acetylase OafA/YrhL
MFMWIALAVVASAGVIFDLMVLPTSWRGRLLSLPPLEWIGRRSYGCYLWHVPILTLLATVHLPTAHEHIECLVLMFALTFAVAGLSYRIVELPFLRREDHFRVVTTA